MIKEFSEYLELKNKLKDAKKELNLKIDDLTKEIKELENHIGVLGVEGKATSEHHKELRNLREQLTDAELTQSKISDVYASKLQDKKNATQRALSKLERECDKAIVDSKRKVQEQKQKFNDFIQAEYQNRKKLASDYNAVLTKITKEFEPAGKSFERIRAKKKNVSRDDLRIIQNNKLLQAR